MTFQLIKVSSSMCQHAPKVICRGPSCTGACDLKLRDYRIVRPPEPEVTEDPKVMKQEVNEV